MGELIKDFYFIEPEDPENRCSTLNMAYPKYAELYNAASKIAYAAHQGQVDKGGERYVCHPIRVANKCSSGRQQAVALLHDVVEDTKVTLDDLRNDSVVGRYPEVIEAVDALTRRKGESYMDFIRRVSENGLALCVKIRDLEDNLDCKRLPSMTEKDWSRMKKYYKARRYLIDCYLHHYGYGSSEPINNKNGNSDGKDYRQHAMGTD